MPISSSSTISSPLHPTATYGAGISVSRRGFMPSIWAGYSWVSCTGLFCCPPRSSRYSNPYNHQTKNPEVNGFRKSTQHLTPNLQPNRLRTSTQLCFPNPIPNRLRTSTTCSLPLKDRPTLSDKNTTVRCRASSSSLFCSFLVQSALRAPSTQSPQSSILNPQP